MSSKKILTFRASSLGDSLMGKYLLENVRAQNPDAKCTLAVSSRVSMIRDLLLAYPWIDVVEINKNPITLISLFMRGRYDIVVTPYTGGVFPLTAKIVARLIARRLIGYADKSKLNRYLYSKIIPLMGRERAPRLLEADALSAIGSAVSIKRPTFSFIPQPQVFERLGLKNKKYIVLHLFSGSDSRGISPEDRLKLINALLESVPDDVTLVLTGSDSERASLGKSFSKNVLLAHTSIQEIAALLDRGAGVISLDTGVAHIAAHMGKPLIVLASCVGSQWWSPDMYGTDIPSALFSCKDVCAGRHDYRGYAKCLAEINYAEVAQRMRLMFF